MLDSKAAFPKAHKEQAISFSVRGPNLLIVLPIWIQSHCAQANGVSQDLPQSEWEKKLTQFVYDKIIAQTVAW